MKRKIGTVIDDSVYRGLRVHAAGQGRNVSDLIEESISAYLSLHEGSMDERMEAFNQLVNPRFVLPREQLAMVLEEDTLDR